MLPLGTIAPDFALPDAYGKEVRLSDHAREARATLIAFWCNHCPYVKHLKKHFAGFADTWRAEGVAFLAINSNDATAKPDDSPERMQEDIETYSYCFPYLVDAWQDVAKSYKAACTPDFYLFDQDLKLYYRGQYDSSRPGNGDEITGEDMAAAIQSLLAGDPPPQNQQPSLGCNIKWLAGNEPEYFG